jgi:hypothetical protein
VTDEFGPVFTEPRVSRGLAMGDLDDDGRVDLVINDLDGPPQVLRNETAGAGHWLSVKLVGKGRNTNAIGALVTVTTGGAAVTVDSAPVQVRVQAGGTRQLRDVRSGTSYISQDDMRAHFGLGAATSAESVEVKWPDGTTSRLENVKADQVITVTQK